jgi:MFS family permease
VILADAVTFLVAGVLIAAFVPRAADPVHPEKDPVEATPPGLVVGYLTELREGLAFLRRDPTLMAIGLMVLVTNLLDQGMSAVLAPVWVHDTLDSPLGLGAISLVFGVGAVTGSLVYSWLGPRLPRRQVYAWGFLAAGAPRFVALALATTLPPVLIVMLVAGLGVGGINPVLAAAEYERTPRELQARVLGALGAMAWLGIPFGGLVAGFMVEAWGLTEALLVFGGAYAVATLAPFVLPSWRGLDRAAEQAPTETLS